MCQLEVRSIEVHALDARCSSFGVLYGNHVALDERLPLVGAEQFARMLTSSHESELALVTRLTTGSERTDATMAERNFKSFGVGIEGLIVPQQ